MESSTYTRFKRQKCEKKSFKMKDLQKGVEVVDEVMEALEVGIVRGSV